MNTDSQDRHENYDLWCVDDFDFSYILLTLNDAVLESEDSNNTVSINSVHNTDTNNIEANSDSSTSLEAFAGTSNLDVKKQLQTRLMQKMTILGTEHPVTKDTSNDTTVYELTPEDNKKQTDKQERNKEAARKSRLKKKAINLKLEKDNKNLTSLNQKLKSDVQQCQTYIKKCKDFFENHMCQECSTQNIDDAQQDHGGNICQATDSTSLYIPKVDSSKNQGQSLSDEDKNYLDKICTDLGEMNVLARIDPMEPEQILSMLQENQRSQQEYNHIFPQLSQSSVQENHYLYQENQSSMQESQIWHQASNQIPLQGSQSTSQEDQSHLFVSNFSYEDQCLGSSNNAVAQNKSKLTMLQGNNHSSVVGSSLVSAPCINAWSTVTDNNSDEIEALLEVTRAMQPPPEKKLRLE